MKRRYTLPLALVLVLVDGALIALAFYLAYVLRLRTEARPLVEPPPFGTYWSMMAIQIVSLVVVFFLAKLYHRRRGTSRIDEFYAIFAAVSIGTIVTTAVTAFIFKNELDYPRLMVVYAWVVTIILVAAGRLLYDAVLAALHKRGLASIRVLLVGTDDVGQTILRRIEESPGLGYRVVGQVNSAPGQQIIANVPVLGSLEDISEIIDAHEIDEVIIGLPEASHEEILSIISRCHRERVSIKVFPDVFQIMASEVSIGHLNGLPLLAVRDVALRGWKLTLKRMVDLIVSVTILILFSPLMLLLAILIKLDSPGPVFYIQERMGLDGRRFQALKFRSMRIGAEDETGPVWASRDDPRRTRLGTFLRRFSLDELPQFINILLGDMSIVGPRPERPVFVEQFKKSIPRYMDRHWEKAGLTGWAQVNGLRGDTSIAERTKYDLYYVENWSLLFDFKIMLMTILEVLRGRNAY